MYTANKPLTSACEMALCFFFFYFHFYSRNSFSAFELKLLFCVWNIYFWDIFRFLLQLLDFTVFPCGFNCTNQRVLHDCVLNVFLFFNLWINIFHLMVWSHASSLHTHCFFSFPLWISPLAHCDDVVFVIITIDLSKLFHCRKFLFFFTSFSFFVMLLFTETGFILLISD